MNRTHNIPSCICYSSKLTSNLPALMFIDNKIWQRNELWTWEHNTFKSLPSAPLGQLRPCLAGKKANVANLVKVTLITQATANSRKAGEKKEKKRQCNKIELKCSGC